MKVVFSCLLAVRVLASSLATVGEGVDYEALFASPHKFVNPPNAKNPPKLDYYFEHKTVMIPTDRNRAKKQSGDAAVVSDEMLVVLDAGASAKVTTGDLTLFAREWMKEFVVAMNARPLGEMVRAASEAYKLAIKKFRGKSAMASVKIHNYDSSLATLIIGDCGWAVYRIQHSYEFPELETAKLLWKSEPRETSFDNPELVGTEAFTPYEVGYSDIVRVEEGSVVVLFSDGVSDNVFEMDLVACLEKQLAAGVVKSLGLAANCIARQAYHHSKDPSYVSPYAKRATEKRGHEYHGGREDDITVTVSQVFKRENKTLKPPSDIAFSESIRMYTGFVPLEEQGEFERYRPKRTPN